MNIKHIFLGDQSGVIKMENDDNSCGWEPYSGGVDFFSLLSEGLNNFPS